MTKQSDCSPVRMPICLSSKEWNTFSDLFRLARAHAAQCELLVVQFEEEDEEEDTQPATPETPHSLSPSAMSTSGCVGSSYSLCSLSQSCTDAMTGCATLALPIVDVASETMAVEGEGGGDCLYALNRRGNSICSARIAVLVTNSNWIACVCNARGKARKQCYERH